MVYFRALKKKQTSLISHHIFFIYSKVESAISVDDHAYEEDIPTLIQPTCLLWAIGGPQANFIPNQTLALKSVPQYCMKKAKQHN